MKKITAIILALVMVLGMSASVFAADAPTITVTGTKGYEYSAYRLFDFEKNETTGAFRYYENSTWTAFYETDTFKAMFDVSTENGRTYVAAKSAFTVDAVAAFAQDALAFAKANGIDPEQTKKAGEDGTAVFTGTKIALGYYLIDSSMGALCVLNTVNPQAAVFEKNDLPEIEKTTDEANEDVAIGQTIPYTITVTAQPGAEGYVVTDTMSAGLTFNKGVVVKVGETALSSTSDYTYVEGGENDSFTFKITFAKTYLDTIAKETDIVITYSGTVNANAVTEVIKNEAKLTYGDGNEIVPTTVTSTTEQIEILKFDANDTSKKNLAGATFKLWDATNETPVLVKLVKIDDQTYRVAAATDTTTTDTFVTTAAGNIVIKGLDKDLAYELEEIYAPTGYNLLPDKVEVTFATEKGKATVVDIENSTGTVLPSTGGIGTTIFYVLGSIMLMGAAVLLVTKKRMTNM